MLPPGISVSSSSSSSLGSTIQTRTGVPDDMVVSTDHNAARIRENLGSLDSEVAESSHETKRPRLNEPGDPNPATPMPIRAPEPHEIPTTSRG